MRPRGEFKEPGVFQKRSRPLEFAHSNSRSSTFGDGFARTERRVDEIIEPADTRKVLIDSLEIATRHADEEPFRTGVLPV
jgi:acetyl-CoA carboxylase carboxyltransferase component